LSRSPLKSAKVNFSFSAIFSFPYLAAGFILAPQLGQTRLDRATAFPQDGQLNVSTWQGWQNGICALASSSSQ
jgi:hypothetical protein